MTSLYRFFPLDEATQRADAVEYGLSASIFTNGLVRMSETATRFSPVDVWEPRDPLLVGDVAPARDSRRPGRQRGGLAVDISCQGNPTAEHPRCHYPHDPTNLAYGGGTGG